jgi:Zn-dependent protease with chaperone function
MDLHKTRFSNQLNNGCTELEPAKQLQKLFYSNGQGNVQDAAQTIPIQIHSKIKENISSHPADRNRVSHLQSMNQIQRGMQ